MQVVVVLHNIRSVYNVASVFRTADGAGVAKIYLVGVTPTPFDRFGNYRKDFSKVALGAEKTVKWEHFKNFGAVYKRLKSDGYEILAVEQDKRAIPYYSYKLNRDIRQGTRDKIETRLKATRYMEEEKTALVFGEETKGLPKSVLDKLKFML